MTTNRVRLYELKDGQRFRNFQYGETFEKLEYATTDGYAKVARVNSFTNQTEEPLYQSRLEMVYPELP